MTETSATYSTGTDEPAALDSTNQELPPDLSPQAVKLARRVQALPVGITWPITLIKLNDKLWMITVHPGTKLETLTR